MLAYPRGTRWRSPITLTRDYEPMSKSTLHDSYVSALLAHGHTLTPNPLGGKYTRLAAPSVADAKPVYLYVGRSGALRIGRNIATSIPVSQGRKAVLLACSHRVQA